ncbi:MAG TPA: efflux transporter outer membrane subunit [Bryobacteraceae bacterium]|jgi:NodT family efflux transporter outer membrane factor (OMF) lipoprotein|nr:efflux transporter outer membrane subunit [Bryobacteraceae bacterium]
MTRKVASVPVTLAFVGLALLLASCTVGPKYSKPPVPAAPAYSEQPPASFKETDGWKQAQPSDSAIRGNWWELFHDPQLNALEEQVGPANQNLKVAEANFRQARAVIALNRAGLFPTIGAAPQITHNRISSNSPTGLNGYDYGNFVLPITVSWDIDFWGRIRRSIAAAREQFQASAADLANAKLELESDLAVDYFEVRSADLQKRILDDTVVAYQKALQLTQNRYEGGVASKAEVAQAQTQLDTAQAQDIDVAAARAQFEHAIAVLTGKPPETFRLPTDPLAENPPVVPVGVPAQLLERRPDIASAERQIAAANEQIGIAKAAFFPDLMITAEGGLQSGSIVNWFTWPSRFWSVGPQLAQTIFDFGRRRAQVQITEAAYDAQAANYRQTALTAFQEVEDNLSTLRILESESAKQHEATVAAENSLQLSLNRYKGGLVTYLEVITAQSIALSNERTEADILRRRMDSSVALIKALGGGWDVGKLPQG